jgi:hypothetical protein
MTGRCETVTGGKFHGFRQPIIDSSAAPVRAKSLPLEAGIRGSGASRPPLLSAAEIEACLRDSESRFGGHSMVKTKTAKKHDLVVSVGQHESRGIPDARYLGIADRVLDQYEERAEEFATVADRVAYSSERVRLSKSKSKTQRDARFLLHYRQG